MGINMYTRPRQGVWDPPVKYSLEISITISLLTTSRDILWWLVTIAFRIHHCVPPIFSHTRFLLLTDTCAINTLLRPQLIIWSVGQGWLGPENIMTGNQLRYARNTPIAQPLTISGYLPLNRRNRRIKNVSNEIYSVTAVSSSIPDPQLIYHFYLI